MGIPSLTKARRKSSSCYSALISPNNFRSQSFINDAANDKRKLSSPAFLPSFSSSTDLLNNSSRIQKLDNVNLSSLSSRKYSSSSSSTDISVDRHSFVRMRRSSSIISPMNSSTSSSTDVSKTSLFPNISDSFAVLERARRNFRSLSFVLSSDHRKDASNVGNNSIYRHSCHTNGSDYRSSCSSRF